MMVIILELESETPLYQQIRDRLVEGIAHGDLVAGQALPSIRQLAADLGINLHTVNKAYALLQRDSFVRMRRTQGVVVAAEAAMTAESARAWQARLGTLLAEAVAHGAPADDILEQCRQVVASFVVAPEQEVSA